MKSGFYKQPVMTSSVVGLRRSSKAPKAKLVPRTGHGHCLLVCCQSDPLQLSESWQNHYIWEVCSANWWDALKTAMPAADTDQQNGPNSFPWQRPTSPCITNSSITEWIGLWSFASSAIFTWPLTNQEHLENTTSSSILTTTFCRENASTTSRRQKMLSKSSSNLEA